MTVKERILAIRLSECIRRQSKYASKIGLSAECKAENPAEQREAFIVQKSKGGKSR